MITILICIKFHPKEIKVPTIGIKFGYYFLHKKYLKCLKDKYSFTKRFL